ncbi:KGG domain-containing protein, partial [Acinetobacter pittii]|uniref:KGG domain-containing protein n=1 Tax=Acinetobacter pittii TaxID=48296 RepID=UPI001BDBAA32
MANTRYEDDDNNRTGTSNRGFASMDPERVREIASKGGRAAHASGNAHEFTSEEAREAGALSHKNDGRNGRGRGRDDDDDDDDRGSRSGGRGRSRYDDDDDDDRGGRSSGRGRGRSRDDDDDDDDRGGRSSGRGRG